MIKRVRNSRVTANSLLWLAGGLLILIGAIWLGRVIIFPDSSASSVQAAETMQGRPLALVQRGGVAAVITATGIVGPAREVNLAFQASGLVSDVAIKPGVVVKKGDVLARLDNRNQQNSFDAAQIQAKRTQDDYDALKSNSLEAQKIENAQAAVRVAQAQLDIVKNGNATSDQIAAAQSRVASVQAKLNQVQSGPDPNQVAAATAALKQAQAKLNQVQTNTNADAIKAAESKVDSALANLERTKSGLTNAVSQADQNHTKAKNALDAAQAACNQITHTTCNPAVALAPGGSNPANPTTVIISIPTTTTSNTNPTTPPVATTTLTNTATISSTATLTNTATISSTATLTNTNTTTSTATFTNTNTTTTNPTLPSVTTPNTTKTAPTTDTPTTLVGKVITASLTVSPSTPVSTTKAVASVPVTTPPAPTLTVTNTPTPTKTAPATPTVSNISTGPLPTLVLPPTATPAASTPPEVVTATVSTIRLMSLKLVQAEPITNTNTPVPPTPVPTGDPNAIAQAQRQLNDAAISYNQAQGTYDDAVAQKASGVRQAQADLYAAQSTVDQLKTGPNAAEVSAAQDEVDQAQALVNDLQQQPKKEEVAVAQAEVSAAQSDLSTLQKGGTPKDIELAQARYDNAMVVLKQLQQGPTAYQLGQSQSAVQAAQVALRQAQLDLDATILRAPFNGVVDKLIITPHQGVRAQEAVITLSDLSALKIDALVSQEYVVRVNTTEQALIRFDSLPKNPALTGHINYISTQATTTADNSNVAYTVSILLDNSETNNPINLGVRPGMKSSVQIVTAYATDVLTVPADTVRSTAGGWVVDTLMKDGNLVTVPIIVGLVGSDGRVEVKTPSLLKPGDKLVVYPPAPLSDKATPVATPTLDVGALNRVRSNSTAIATVTPDLTDNSRLSPAPTNLGVGTPAPVSVGATIQASPVFTQDTNTPAPGLNPGAVETPTALPTFAFVLNTATAAPLTSASQATPVRTTTLPAPNVSPPTSIPPGAGKVNTPGSEPTLALQLGTPLVTGTETGQPTFERVPGTPNAIPTTAKPASIVNANQAALLQASQPTQTPTHTP